MMEEGVFHNINAGLHESFTMATKVLWTEGLVSGLSEYSQKITETVEKEVLEKVNSVLICFAIILFAYFTLLLINQTGLQTQLCL